MYEKEIANWKLLCLKTTRLHFVIILKALYWKKFMAPGCVWRTVDGRTVMVARGPGTNRWHKAARKFNDKIIVVPVRQKPNSVKIEKKLLQRPRLAFRLISVPALLNDSLAFLDLAACGLIPLSDLDIFMGRMLPDELGRIAPILARAASTTVALRMFYEL